MRCTSDAGKKYRFIRTYGTSSYALAKLERLILRARACLEGFQNNDAKCGEQKILFDMISSRRFASSSALSFTMDSSRRFRSLWANEMYVALILEP